MKKVILALSAAIALAATPALSERTYSDQKLISKWEAAHKACEGNGPSRQKIGHACGLREKVAHDLNQRNWCWDHRINLWTVCIRQDNR